MRYLQLQYSFVYVSVDEKFFQNLEKIIIKTVKLRRLYQLAM